jgi:MOSC domain-containing protein YiiM
MTPPTLTSIQAAQPVTYLRSRSDGNDEPWQSAIDKTAVSGPVAVERTGLASDAHADRQNHGGIDKAVLAYAAAHYDDWQRELPQHAWRPGGFGENLTIDGLDETLVCLGDVYRTGDVLLEVSQPRQPCWKLCLRWNQPDLAKRVVATARSGWYLRVKQTGTIHAGLPVELIERPLPDWTIERAARLMYGLIDDRSAAEELARLPQVSMAWREDLIDRRLV